MNLQVKESNLDKNRLKEREAIYRQADNDLHPQYGPITELHWRNIFADRVNRGPGYQQELDRLITAVDRILDVPHFEYKGYKGTAKFDRNKLIIQILNIDVPVTAVCNDTRRAEYTFKELVRDYIQSQKGQ